MAKTHVKLGLIIAAFIVLIDIVLQVTHQKLQVWSDYPARIILFVGVMVATFLQSKSINACTFSQLVGYGFKVATVVVCVLFLYTVLSVYFVFPNYVESVFVQSIEEAKKTPGFNMAEVEKNTAIAKKVIAISLISGMVLLNLAIGLVSAVIAGILFQKKVVQ